jgi:hypothetical protein
MTTDDLANITRNPDFSSTLSAMVAEVHTGGISISKAVALTHSHEKETATFCFDRLADPTLSQRETETLLHLLEPRETATLFVNLLFERDEAVTKRVAAKLNRASAGLQYQIASRLQAADAKTVMQALELLEVFEPDRIVLPRLFAAVGRNLPAVTARIALLLQRLDTNSVYTRRLLQHPDPRVRAGVLQAMLQCKGGRSLEYLRLCNEDRDNRVRVLAALGLHWHGEPSGVKSLMHMAQDPSAAVRWSAVWALGICRCSETASLLQSLLQNDPDPHVREQARLAASRVQSGPESETGEHSPTGSVESEGELSIDRSDASTAAHTAEFTADAKPDWAAPGREESHVAE